MMVSVESSDGLTRTLRVEVPAERIDSEIEQRLRKVGKTAKVPGFRPGKIPLKVIKQRYGPQVRQEVLGDIMQSSYSEAIRQEDLSPAGSPQIETEESDSGLAYKATFEVMPVVELADVACAKVSRPNVAVTAEDVDAMLESLREQRATWEVVERAAASGDQVVVDFQGAIDGEPLANGRGENVPVELGSGRMLEDFERALDGASGGAALDFDVNYPDDYPQEDLAGKTAAFHADVKEVKEKRLPPLDDEFASDFGIAEGGLAKLREDVESNMHNEVAQKVHADIKEQVLTTFLAGNPLDVPQAMVHREAYTMQQEWMRRAGVEDQNAAPPAANFAEAAERRVKLTFLLQEFVQREALSVSDDALKARIAEMFEGYDEKDRIIENYISNPELRAQVEPLVLEDIAVDRLIELGSEESRDVGFSEYMNP